MAKRRVPPAAKVDRDLYVVLAAHHRSVTDITNKVRVGLWIKLLKHEKEIANMVALVLDKHWNIVRSDQGL